MKRLKGKAVILFGLAPIFCNLYNLPRLKSCCCFPRRGMCRGTN